MPTFALAQAGTLVKHSMLSARDKSGLSLGEVMEAEVKGDASASASASAAQLAEGLALPPGSVGQYIEVHIEQVGGGLDDWMDG